MELKQELRSRGYRLTPQRRKVLDAVTELVHARPDDVNSYLLDHGETINLSTIYRTLELLEGLGLVTHAHLGHGAPTYHSSAVPDHLHLVCHDCGSVTEASTGLAAGLVDRLRRDHDFEPEVTHLTIFGRCKACADELA